MLAIQDLARKVIEGKVPTRAQAAKMTDEALIGVLTEVKGVGDWTAHMFLIFTLGRTDVLPIGEYGVRKGFQALYGKKEMPTPKELHALTKHWSPYRSVASWYMWRVLEMDQYKSKVKTKAGSKPKRRAKKKSI